MVADDAHGGREASRPASTTPSPPPRDRPLPTALRTPPDLEVGCTGGPSTRAAGQHGPEDSSADPVPHDRERTVVLAPHLLPVPHQEEHPPETSSHAVETVCA